MVSVRSFAETRARARLYSVPDQVKRCECGSEFPIERNSRNQITSRKLCDACRESRTHRVAAVLPGLEHAPRCAGCQAVVGLAFGGSITALDENNLCRHCADWEHKRAAKAKIAPQPVQRDSGAQSVKATADSVRTVSCVPQWVIDLVMRTADCPHCGHGYAEPVLQPAVQPEHEILPPPTPAEIEAIIAKVGADHGYTPEELRSKKRDGDLCVARQEAYFQLRERGLSLEAVGKALGHRHHTTVMAGVEVVKTWSQTERPGPSGESEYTSAGAACRLGTTVNDIRYRVRSGQLPGENRDVRLWIPAVAVEAMRGDQ